MEGAAFGVHVDEGGEDEGIGEEIQVDGGSVDGLAVVEMGESSRGLEKGREGELVIRAIESSSRGGAEEESFVIQALLNKSPDPRGVG